MAQQSKYEILIETLAETAGLEDTREQLRQVEEGLVAQRNALAAAAQAEEQAGQSAAGLREQLLAVNQAIGAMRMGDVAGAAQYLAAAEREAASATGEHAQAAHDLGNAAGPVGSLGEAVQAASNQAGQLGVKLAEGKLQMKDLVSAAVQLSGPLGAAGAAGLALYNAINAAAEAQNRLALETLKFSQEAARISAAATEAVRSGEVLRIARQVEAAQQRLLKLREELNLKIIEGDEAAVDGLREQIGQQEVLSGFLDRMLEKRQKAVDLAEQQKQLDEAGLKFMSATNAKYDEADRAAERLRKTIQDVEFAELDPQGQLKSLQSDLGEVEAKLGALGVSAASPAEALTQLGNHGAEARLKIIPLIEKWLDLEQAVKRVGDQQARNAAVTRGTSSEAISQIDEQIAKVKELEEILSRQAGRPTPRTPEEEINDRITKAKEQLEGEDFNLRAVAQQEIERLKEELAAAKNAQEKTANKPSPTRGADGDNQPLNGQNRGQGGSLPQGGSAGGEQFQQQIEQLKQRAQSAEEAAQGVIDAAGAVITPLQAGLDAAEQNFDGIATRFTDFSQALQPVPQAISKAAEPIPAAIAAIGDVTSAGFSSIIDALNKVTNVLQGQIRGLETRVAGLERWI